MDVGENMGPVCINCEKEGPGTPVKEDWVIRGIRSVKQRLNIARNAQLVVCADCLEKHEEKRKKFEKNLVMYAGIAVILTFLLLAFALFFGSNTDLWAILRILFLGACLVALFVVLAFFHYVPAVQGAGGKKLGIKAGVKKEEKKAKPKKKAK